MNPLTSEQKDIVACLVTKSANNLILMERAHSFLNYEYQPWKDIQAIERRTKTNKILALLTTKKILKVSSDRKSYLICENHSEGLKQMLLPSPGGLSSSSSSPLSIDFSQEYQGVLAELASPKERRNPYVISAPEMVKHVWKKQYDRVKEHDRLISRFLEWYKKTKAQEEGGGVFEFEELMIWCKGQSLSSLVVDPKYLNIALKKLVDQNKLAIFNAFEDYSCNQELCVYQIKKW